MINKVKPIRKPNNSFDTLNLKRMIIVDKCLWMVNTKYMTSLIEENLPEFKSYKELNELEKKQILYKIRIKNIEELVSTLSDRVSFYNIDNESIYIKETQLISALMEQLNSTLKILEQEYMDLFSLSGLSNSEEILKRRNRRRDEMIPKGIEVPLRKWKFVNKIAELKALKKMIEIEIVFNKIEAANALCGSYNESNIGLLEAVMHQEAIFIKKFEEELK